MMQVRITFPSLYPNMAPPSFHLLSNISPHSAVKAKETLVDTAQEYVDKAQNCLEPCFKKLMELMKQESETNAVAVAVSSPTAALSSVASLPKIREGSGNLPSLLKTPSFGGGSYITPGSPAAAAAANSSGIQVPEGHTLYMVKPMDSLAAIALACKMTVSALRKLNKIHHSGQLMPGQLLVVKLSTESPNKSPTSPTGTPSTPGKTAAAGPSSPIDDSIVPTGISSAPTSPYIPPKVRPKLNSWPK